MKKGEAIIKGFKDDLDVLEQLKNKFTKVGEKVEEIERVINRIKQFFAA